MSRWFLAPAFAVLKQVTFLAGFALTGALFLVPIAIATWAALVGTPAPGAVLAWVLVTTALALYLLTAVHYYMVYGVDRLVRVTERVAAGELVNTRDSVGEDSSNSDSSRLWSSILNMNDRLAQIVRQVRASAQGIVVAARDIAEGNHHLAQRTQEQAAALEQTASGLEELAATAQQNAADCARANSLAAGARDVATKAATQMQQLARKMKEIDDSARRVADILATVEGIAFQTNILALNAAVEAARAGDQGRGFAVVATEVRSLAQRSAEAAREIKGLIAASTGSVDEGRRVVTAAEATMLDVVGSVREVSEVIGSIAGASAEQRTGIEAVNQAVLQIDAANQQNAALVEEASAAASSFEHEATQLMDVVSRFKIDRGSDRAKAVALVKSAAAHLRKVGRERACADFNDNQGRFVQGEYYVFALTLGLDRLAYAPDPRLVGTNGMHLQDADGRYYGRDILDLAKQHGMGWTDFQILNPKTGRVEPKSVYVELVDDVILGCGIYRNASEDAAAGPQPAPPRRAYPGGPPLPQLAGAGGR